MSPRRVPSNLVWLGDVSWRLVAVATVVWIAMVVISATRHVVIPLVFAMFFAALLGPMARWLERRGLPTALAASAVLLATLALIAGVLVWAGIRFREQADALGDALVHGWDRLLSSASDVLPVSRGDIEGFVHQLRAGGGSARSLVVGGASSVIDGVLMLLLTVVFLFFLLKDGPRMAGWIGERLPHRVRSDAEAVGPAMWDKLTSFARGQTLIAFVDAVLTAIALVIIGVPLVLVLSILTFLGGFIPLVGPVVATIVAGLVALSAGGLSDALWVVAAEIAIQQVEGNVLHPVVMARAVRLHPMIVILAVTTGGIVAGIVGAFAAVPLLAAVTAAVGEMRSRKGPVRPSAAEREGA